MTTIFSITSHKWAIGQLTTRHTEIVRGADWKQVDRRRGLNNWQRARASIVHNSLVERARPCPPLPATTNIIGSSHTQHIYSQQSTRDCASVCSLLLWLFFFFRLKCVLLCELAIAWRGPKSVWRSRSSLAINNQHPIRLLFVHDGVDYDIYTKGEYIDWNRSTLRLHLHCDTCKFTLT